MTSCTRQTLGKLLLCGLVVSACGEKNASTSTLQHNLSQPVRAAEDWNWVTLSRSDFVNHSLNMGPHQTRFPIADRFHILEDRAVFWVNLLDQKLRDRFPEDLKQVPKPQVQVITDNTPNAFIAAGFSCYDVPLQLAATGTSIDKIFWSPEEGHGAFMAWPKGYACQPAEPSTLYAAIQAFNAAEGTCKLHVDNGTVQLDPTCTIPASLQGVANATSIVLPRTANWVTIHAGLFPLMQTERAFVGVLMHELTHYYRSHITHLSGEYNFFYQRGEENEAHRPEARPDLAPEGQKAVLASHIIGQALHTIEDQQLAPELYLASGSLAQNQCTAPSTCAASCQEIVTLATNKGFVEKMALYPFSPADTATYQQFETTMLACLETLPASDAYPKLQTLMAAPTWIPFSKKLSDASRLMIGMLLGQIIPRLPTTLPRPTYASAKEVTLDVSTILHMQQKLAVTLLTEAHEQKIGFYTVEQEADEASLEWLALIGIQPTAGVETYLTLAGDSTESSFGGFIWGGKVCKDLYRNHWKDEHGNAVVVPIGNFAESHHSSCFRAYNADLEIQAHQYPIGQSDTIAATGISWKEIQRTAMRAILLQSKMDAETPVVTPTPADVAAQKWFLALNKHWKECPWAPK